MVEHVCCETAIASGHGLSDIVVAARGDSIVFPHVSSCCAFIFLMPGGSAVGGHASIMPPDPTASPNAQAQSADMLTRMYQAAGAVPGCIVAISSAMEWSTPFQLAQAGIAALANCQAANYCGVLEFESDIFLELGAGRLQAQRWVSGPRAETDAPARTGNLVFDQALPTLRRSNRGPCCCIL